MLKNKENGLTVGNYRKQSVLNIKYLNLHHCHIVVQNHRLCVCACMCVFNQVCQKRHIPVSVVSCSTCGCAILKLQRTGKGAVIGGAAIVSMFYPHRLQCMLSVHRDNHR